jgi:hypothetical protein
VNLSKRRSHHYVPRCYLRGFSIDENERQIAVLHIASGELIPEASIADQACSHRFYGNDDIEIELGKIESAISPTLAHLRAGLSPAKLNGIQSTELRLFCLLAQARTPSAAAESDEMVDKVVKQLILMDHPDAKHELSAVRVSFRNSVIMRLKEAFRLLPSLLDLRIKLLRAPRSAFFISSDNPVIVGNPLLRGKSPWSGEGIACRGYVLFMPLSMRYGIILYDDTSYQLGSDNHTIITSDNSTVDSLNTVQAASASDVLFAGKGYSVSEMKRYGRIAREFAPKPRVQVDVVEEVNVLGNASGKLLHVHPAGGFPHMDVKQFHELIEYRDTDLSRLPIRNAAINRALDRFEELVNKGDYEQGDVLLYYADIVAFGPSIGDDLLEGAVFIDEIRANRKKLIETYVESHAQNGDTAPS